jgi:adenosylcobinamide kinase/adenosylcobinamide-phosphate guanylyltransferase
MGELILVLGGARSGKSTFAQNLAQQIGGPDVLFVATAEARDEEMRTRVAAHKQARPSGWRTLEAQQQVGEAAMGATGGAQVVLVDCMTLLASNRLMAFDDPFTPEAEATVMEEVHGLIACAREMLGAVIVVSNEAGMGLVPPYPLGRAFRDALGKANQVLAASADRVYLMVAGLPLEIKQLVNSGPSEEERSTSWR